MRDMRFVLLNDLPLEKINTDSRMLVLPEPLDPKKNLFLEKEIILNF